ncbi:S1/P1 nuclease [Mucilaginibacter sp. AW1-3]
MKYRFLSLFALVLAIVLVSWGGIGHKTVATIAENHLTPEAKTSIKALLGEQSIADIASWADEVRNTPEYKSTGPEHYVDLNLGYSFAQFSEEVKNQKDDNVYKALLKYEAKLKSNTTPNEEKTIALKFIVHFVGDLHQPMHVSRAEDKGGNSIQVQFNGNGSNLHSLWDSGLINREGKTFDQMAKDYDNTTPADNKKWQAEDPIQWLWESYQVSTKIYADVVKSNKLDDDYYKANIPVVQERIEKGGIRLAGELNKIFTQYPVKGIVIPIGTPMSANAPKVIDIKDAGQHINEWVCITAQAYSSRSIGEMILVNLGAAYPGQLLTIVLKEGAQDLKLDGRNITVKGKVIAYKGKPEIEVTDPQQISVH